MQVSVSWATSGSYSGKNGSFLHVCFSAAPILQHNNFNNTKFCVLYWAADIHIPLYTMNENLLQYILFSIYVFYLPFACRVELIPRGGGAGDCGRPVQCLPATRRQWTVDTRARTHPLRYRWPSHYELIIHDGRNNVMWTHFGFVLQFNKNRIFHQSIIFTILPVSTSLEELGHVAFNDWLPTEQNGAWDGSGGSVVSGSNMCMCILPIIGNTVLCGQSPNFQQQQQLVKGLSIRDWLL